VDWPTTKCQFPWALASAADLSLTQISSAGQTAGRGWVVGRDHPEPDRKRLPRTDGERGQTPIPALSQASQMCRRHLIQDLFMVLSCVPIETAKPCLLPAAFRPPGADPSSATQAIDVPCQGAMTVPTCVANASSPPPRRGANRSNLSRRPERLRLDAIPAGQSNHLARDSETDLFQVSDKTSEIPAGLALQNEIRTIPPSKHIWPARPQRLARIPFARAAVSRMAFGRVLSQDSFQVFCETREIACLIPDRLPPPHPSPSGGRNTGNNAELPTGGYQLLR
jgi:hypothetical protein